MKVVQFPVHDQGYPRNRLLREAYASEGWTCSIVSRGPRGKTTLKTKVAAVRELFRESRNAQVVQLTELSLQYAVLTWMAARRARALHVVDGFVGLYETEVEDKGVVRPGTVRATAFRVLDYLALVLADVYLVDTRLRRDLLATGGNARFREKIVSVPVGAPGWARPAPYSREQGSPLKVLYYGNYIPLHGLEYYVRALNELPAGFRVDSVMIGDGQNRRSIESLVSALGAPCSITFLEPVAENQLSEHIRGCDVVLGIFGTSRKAGTVIANKVWQGLASGKVTLTRESAALDELRPLVGELLQTVRPAAPNAIAARLVAIAERKPPAPNGVSDALDGYVRREVRKYLARIYAARGNPGHAK